MNNLEVLLTNSFRTLTGGTLYYDHRNFLNNNKNKNIPYIKSKIFANKYKSIISHRTIIWLGEEIHKVNCEPNILLVEHGDFISEGFELFQVFFQKHQELLYSTKK
jgi:hypothetical protein